MTTQPPPAPPVGMVRSTNVAAPVRQRVPRSRATGIVKEPAPHLDVADPGPRRTEGGAGVSGVAGDFVGNGRHHGGAEQAVYAVAREELDWWGAELHRELPDGLFGENLTTAGLDVDAAEVGDVWRVGSAVLRVEGPRVPCATFAERMGERGWVRRFADRGRSGAYLSVLTPGRIAAGDTIEVTRSGSGVGLPFVLAALLGDVEAAREVERADALGPTGSAALAKALRRA